MKWNEENNCLSDEMLQHYIDEELSLNEQIKIEKHLAECEYCSAKFQDKKKLIELLSNGVPSVKDNEIIVPDFHPPEKQKLEGRKKKHIYWWSTAASILILISLFLFKNTDDTDINLEYVYKEMNEEIDANKPWHEQTTTIYILNESGEIIDKIENL
jgi:predicted anti-sigma-YlaC factor YlaD